MSRKKIEIQEPIKRSAKDDEEPEEVREEELEEEYEQQNAEVIGSSLRDESQSAQTIITANNTIYTEKMLLARLEEKGLLDDYLGEGKEISERSIQWVESFSRDDLIQIFITFPTVFERCKDKMSKTIGPAIKDVLLFNDMFCNLLENILKKAKNVHLSRGWGFSEGTPEFEEFEFAVSLFYAFVEEDAHSLSKTPRLSNALNSFAASNFVNLNNAGLPSIYTQLYNLSYHGNCTAGFSEQLSRTYTAIMLARAILFYGNVLQSTQTKELSNSSGLWNSEQAATFFKMNSELKKEMESPLYHGNIDTEAAKRLLSNPGDYLARYSSDKKEYFLTIMLDNIKGTKIVLNLPIPEEQVELWITKPMEHHEEIEAYIKKQFMSQSGRISAIINKFLLNERYSPIHNPICNEDIRKASLGIG